MKSPLGRCTTQYIQIHHELNIIFISYVCRINSHTSSGSKFEIFLLAHYTRRNRERDGEEEGEGLARGTQDVVDPPVLVIGEWLQSIRRRLLESIQQNLTSSYRRPGEDNVQKNCKHINLYIQVGVLMCAYVVRLRRA